MQWLVLVVVFTTKLKHLGKNLGTDSSHRISSHAIILLRSGFSNEIEAYEKFYGHRFMLSHLISCNDHAPWWFCQPNQWIWEKSRAWIWAFASIHVQWLIIVVVLTTKLKHLGKSLGTDSSHRILFRAIISLRSGFRSEIEAYEKFYGHRFMPSHLFLCNDHAS